MRTRLELGTSGSIELTDDVPYSLNYAVADIRTPDKRDANYSKTIKIPGSKANDILFGHIFNIDMDCAFNPNIKTPCKIFIDDTEVMNGFLQMLKIYRTDNNKIEYEVSIKGNVGNIFTEIGDDELVQLDLSEYDHTYAKSVQKASWTAPVGVGYVYPMLDYGLNNGIVYRTSDLFPAVYVKTYWDKIFEYAGYRYNSMFLNSDYFKRLIIPYNGGGLKYTEAFIADAYVEEQAIGSFPIYSISVPTTGSTDPTTTLVQYNFEVQDNQNQFTTNRFKPAGDGTYNIDIDFNCKQSSGTSSVQGFIYKYNSTDGYVVLGSTGIATVGGITTSFLIGLTDVPLLFGDEVFVGIKIARLPGTVGVVNMNFGESGNGGSFISYLTSNAVDGDTIQMNTAIPQKVKMKDFLKSIIQMHNLYIETDKDNSTILNIEPRNDFYSSGTTIDWTDKLDISQPLVLDPIAQLEARTYVFNYKDDNDYYNALYKEDKLEPYGTYNYTIENDFLTKRKDNTLIFSPTPLTDWAGTDRIVSSIIPSDISVTKVKPSNIRILYYGGVFNTSYPYILTDFVEGQSTETTWAYAGHLDNPYAPTLDICFGVPKEVFYTTTVYTNNHLFNKYYLEYIEEISDKDSKIVTGMFYLTPYDILTLDFRNQFLVDGHLLRLNKIYDYNPVNEQLTKCEFIKIKKALQFVPEVKTGYSGYDLGFLIR